MAIERINLATRDEWLAERRFWIGASEVPTVCGEASYGSLAELYAEKKGMRPPLVDSAVLRRGRWGEAAVFEALAEERPEWDVVRAKLHVRCTDRRLACTPDGFATAPEHEGVGVVQAKVISRSIFRQRWLDDPDDRIDGSATPPAAYQLQTLAEMMLNELSWGVIAVVVNGEFDWTLRLFEIERDAVIEDRINYRVAWFWQEYLDANIMPPFEPQRDEKLVRQLFPRDNGSEIDLSGDNRALALVEDWIQTKAALSRLEKQQTGIKTELQGKLGDHTFGRLADGRRLSWKLQHRKAHTVAAADFRVLRLVAAKESAE